MPGKQHQPAVLTTDCINRVRLLNEVARDLKHRGFTLGKQELHPVRWATRPAIEIKRNLSCSIMQIVCQSDMTWFEAGRGYAVYRGVTVWWRL